MFFSCQLSSSLTQAHQLHAHLPELLLVLLAHGLAVWSLLLAVVEVAPTLVLRSVPRCKTSFLANQEVYSGCSIWLDSLIVFFIT